MGVVCNVEDAPDGDEIIVEQPYVDEPVQDVIEEVHSGRRDMEPVQAAP